MFLNQPHVINTLFYSDTTGFSFLILPKYFVNLHRKRYKKNEMDKSANKDFDPLKLENQLCFSIYAASRLMTRLYQPYLDHLGITYPQYLVLMVLWENEGIGVNEIGCKLYLNTNTLTPLLKRMEHLELIKRVKCSKDERKVLIYLTDKGSVLKKDAQCIPLEMANSIDFNLEKAMCLKKELENLINQMLK